MQELINSQIEHLTGHKLIAPSDKVKDFLNDAKGIIISNEVINRCLRPLQQHFQSKIRIIV